MKDVDIKGEGWSIEPFDLEVPEQPHGQVKETKTKPVASTAFGECPSCHSGKRTGLVRSGNHLVWRLHDRTLLSGSKMPCPSSGVAVCAMPSKGHDGPTCPHY